MMTAYLEWPEEHAGTSGLVPRWFHPGSNICLDFHGDPVRAQFVVFSDGNHHMALRECLDVFASHHEGLSHIFYATTPPGPVVTMLQHGGLQLGNLTLSMQPDVFISPANILDNLVNQGFMTAHAPFIKNRGNVLLVKKGNPKDISGPADIMADNVRLFLSHPEHEKASYTAYYQTLNALLSNDGVGDDFLQVKLTQQQVHFGERIHHREAPHAVAAGAADVAPVFYHLALRYLRIFPEQFDIVPLGGSVEAPAPLPGNVVGTTSAGLVGDGGTWGKKFIDYLASNEALQIYERHGLSSLYAQ